MARADDGGNQSRPTVFRHDRRSSLRGLLLAFILLGVSGRLALEGRRGDQIVGCAGLVVFGLFAVILLDGIIRRPPVLSISEAGVTLHRGILPGRPRLIVWNEIRGVSIFRWQMVPRVAGQRALGFDLTEPFRPGWRGRIDRLNVRLAGTPVLIGEGDIGTDLDEVATLMKQFCPAVVVDADGSRTMWDTWKAHHG